MARTVEIPYEAEAKIILLVLKNYMQGLKGMQRARLRIAIAELEDRYSKGDAADYYDKLQAIRRLLDEAVIAP